MSEPRADWGKDLVKAVEAMRDEIKSHKDETNTLTKELSAFQSEVETVFEIFPPKEMGARVNALVTDLTAFQSKVETLISVTKGSARILVVFLLGTIGTVITGAITLVSAVNAQKVETAHLARQVERLEASLTRKTSSSAGSVEPAIKKLYANVENIPGGSRPGLVFDDRSVECSLERRGRRIYYNKSKILDRYLRVVFASVRP